MPMKPLTAARIVCEQSGWSISNLKLQKILYLAQMSYMGNHEGRALIDGSFEAWDYGPVSSEVYNEVSGFGRNPIDDVFTEMPYVDEEEKECLITYSNDLLKFNAAQLVGITHWEGGAWAKCYIPGAKSVVIPPEDIFEEYKARVSFGKKKKKSAAAKRR